MSTGRIVTCLSFLVFLFARGAWAEELPAPSGPTLLTISGAISNTNGDGVADFDLAMLEAMRQETVTTHTPWYDGAERFEGVPLADLMKLAGAHGKTVQATALNDYVVHIPIEDFERFGVVLALKRAGAYMSVREKGPLFIIYPFDANPQLQGEVYYRRAVWQLRKLVVQ